QLNQQLATLQQSMEAHKNQVNVLNSHIQQLQTQLAEAQTQARSFSAENVQLKQQIGPLQAKVNELTQEISAKNKRIEELKEPKPVMPSTLASTSPYPSSQQPTMPTPAPTPSIPSTEPTISPKIGLGTGIRRVCPNCGSTAIKEVEDKTKIVSYIPKPIYAKKNICTKCGYEF
ncbi:unnamed protein product, partial [marine sediment metagenome]